jgi:hypothetical protein
MNLVLFAQDQVAGKYPAEQLWYSEARPHRWLTVVGLELPAIEGSQLPGQPLAQLIALAS